MKVILLCEHKSSDDGLRIRSAVQDILKREGHSAQTVIISTEEIKHCVACLGCWVKTPGQCVITGDEINGIVYRLINADAVILLSEIVYGGFSSDIKVFLDRSIQTVLPYFVNYKGETHHPPRYRRYPTWFAVGYGDVSDAEKRTFIALATRNALNIRPDGHLAVTVKNSDELEEMSFLKTLEVRA